MQNFGNRTSVQKVRKKQDHTSLNAFDDRIKVFESQKTRKLTIFGKACVVYSKMISQLIYKSSIQPFPDREHIQQFNFLWNKHDRIKRDTVKGEQKDGWLGIVDTELKKSEKQNHQIFK